MTSIPPLQFDPAQATGSVLATARAALIEYPEVSGSNFDAVHDAALEMIRVGGDQSILFKALGAAGLSKGRAGYITAEVWKRAWSLMGREKMLRLGIVEADWLFSGAPCEGVDHAPYDRRRYRVADGLETSEGRIHPGATAGSLRLRRSALH